jgi:hypothetical protein
VLYYGALCLAKAVAIANLPGVRHDDTGFRYHGLTSRASCCADPVERSGLQQYGQDPSRWAVTKEFAILHGGVFPRLVEALAGWAPGAGEVVYLRDLLTRLPSLIPHAELHLGNAPAIAKLYSSLEPTKDDPNTLVLAVRETDAAWVRGELLAAGFTEREGLHHSQARQFAVARQTAEALTSLGVEHHPLGPMYLYGHVPGTDAWWPQPAVCLAALWILSETVRYRPVLWRRAIGPDAEGLLPLVEAFLSDVRRAYPNYILTALEGRRVTYGPAAYYT